MKVPLSWLREYVDITIPGTTKTRSAGRAAAQRDPPRVGGMRT